MNTRFIAMIVMVGVLLPAIFISAAEYANPIQAMNIEGVLSALITFAENIVKPLAVIAILWAAFLYVSAGGSEDKVSKAHKALTYGIIGLAIILSGKFLVAVLGGAASKSAGATFTEFIYSLARIFGLFIMAASVIAILYSAFLFLTSSGEPDKITTARQALLYAVIGVAVAMVAFIVPQLVGQVVPQ